MKSIDPGHKYELDNLEGGTQTLQFIRKERGPAETSTDALKTLTNGTTTEEVIHVVIDRLEVLSSRLADANTAAAIESMKNALTSLENRTADRAARGVEGTDQA